MRPAFGPLFFSRSHTAAQQIPPHIYLQLPFADGGGFSTIFAENGMDTNFAVGDLVKLKSGGVLMCLRHFRGEDAEHAVCVWHNGSKPCERIYPLAALIRVEFTASR